MVSTCFGRQNNQLFAKIFDQDKGIVAAGIGRMTDPCYPGALYE